MMEPHGAIAEHAFTQHEHRELAPGVDRIHDVARVVGRVTPSDLSLALLDVIDWIDQVLEPHAGWEDTWLYPEFDDRAGTPWATKLMRFEHGQIRDVARNLKADRDLLRHDPGHAEAVELLGHLFALEALLRAHIEREEMFLIPLLEDEASPARRGPASRRGDR